MAQEQEGKPVTYGDLFEVSGELASKPVAPGDAAVLQLAENVVIGMPQKDGPAAALKSAARKNETLGVVGHEDMTDLVRDKGVALVEAEAGGRHIVTEVVAGQVLGSVTGPVSHKDPQITIGEALEAATLSAGERPITKTEVAAIEAAEMKATGRDRPLPGGIAEEAKSAAYHNLKAVRDEDKITVQDILADAKSKLPDDRPVLRDVAEAVVAAELRTGSDMASYPGGVASCVAGAARLNEQN